MAVFVVRYLYVDDADKLTAIRPEHRAFLQDLNDNGTVIVSGPLNTFPGKPGGLIILNANSAEEVFTIIANDPFAREQLISETSVGEWQPLIGKLA